MSDPLANSPLSWSRAGVDGVKIEYGGRPVSIVKGQDASTAMGRLRTAGSTESQLILADLMTSNRKGKRR